jgi:carbon storage regulator
MLILTRKPGESLYIDDDIKIIIKEIKGNQVRIGVEAPASRRIYREEIYLQILEENRSAAQTPAPSDAGLADLSDLWAGRKSLNIQPVKAGGAVKSPSKIDVVVKRKRPRGSGESEGE